MLNDADPVILRFILQMATLVAGVAIIYLKQDRMNRKVDRVSHNAKAVADKADAIAENTKSVSNGFAGNTTQALSDLRDMVVRIELKIDGHMRDHAAADVARHGKEQ